MTTNMTAEFETVTAEKAAKYLETNAANRPLTAGHVKELSAELEEDRYIPTHQGIAFDTQGRLVDGQHRLTAIIKTGVPMLLLVTRGVDPRAFKVIDQGRRRTAGQLLAIDANTKNPAKIGQMAKTIMAVVLGDTHAGPAKVNDYAREHRETLELFLPVARKYGPAVAAAFAWAHSLGWYETESAAARLTEKLWSDADDPMRALDRRSETFKALGSGAAGTKARFDITLNCLLAVHEGRGMQQARSARPDYRVLERRAAEGADA